jgi:hypothetical protein
MNQANAIARVYQEIIQYTQPTKGSHASGNTPRAAKRLTHFALWINTG